MYMNFQFAAARKHKFLLIHGQRSKEDQRWRLNKSRVQRYISYQDLPGSSDWSDNIGGFRYRFHHHWILMNFALGQHGGRSKLSLATGPQIVHLLETIICSDWSKDANRMYLYSLTTAGTVLCRNTTYHAYFWHSSCCIWSFRSRTYIQCFFFQAPATWLLPHCTLLLSLIGHRLFSYWNATDLCNFEVDCGRPPKNSFCSLESDAHKCYVWLCWKIFQSTSRSMYGLTTEQDTFPGFQSLCHEVLRVLPRTQVTCLLGGEFFWSWLSHGRCCTPKTVAGYRGYTVHYSSIPEDCEYILLPQQPVSFNMQFGD